MQPDSAHVQPDSAHVRLRLELCLSPRRGCPDWECVQSWMKKSPSNWSSLILLQQTIQNVATCGWFERRGIEIAHSDAEWMKKGMCRRPVCLRLNMLRRSVLVFQILKQPLANLKHYSHKMSGLGLLYVVQAYRQWMLSGHSRLW